MFFIFIFSKLINNLFLYLSFYSAYYTDFITRKRAFLLFFDHYLFTFLTFFIFYGSRIFTLFIQHLISRLYDKKKILHYSLITCFSHFSKLFVSNFFISLFVKQLHYSQLISFTLVFSIICYFELFNTIH